jgi:hypothetical protein
VLNRCQRVIGRRNQHSQGPMFDRILRRHREMHDLSTQRLRADYNHALDTWQWTLRLKPSAWSGVQIAALFHDVGRVMSVSLPRWSGDRVEDPGDVGRGRATL